MLKTVSRREIPFDLAATEGRADWRDDFAWPMAHGELKGVVADVAQRYLQSLWAIPDPDARRLGILASRAMSELLLVVETAVLIGAARCRNLTFTGGPPLVAALGGGSEGTTYTPRASLVYRPIKNQMLRRASRVMSWTPWYRLPGALMFPDAISLSHNSLLRSEARLSGRNIGFVHAERLLGKTSRREREEGAADSSPVLAALRAVIEGTSAIPSDLIQLCCDLLSERTAGYLDELALDLMAVQSLDLPHEVWCGSAGHRPVRTVALEVARRGGQVVVHDHAGAAGLFIDADSLILTEFNVGTRFVTNTARTADLVRAAGTMDRIVSFKQIELVGGHGDPFFAPQMSKRTAGQRKRVLYVVGAFDGQARRSPPSLPDPQKLDWWLRVATHLAALPIDFKVQAHPGGVMRGRPSPLRAAVEVSSRRFEEMLDWADLLVIDVTQSTTLTQAFCTNIPIVLIDYGRNVFNPALRPLVDARCKTVFCQFDDRNRVQIDSKALTAAVLEEPEPFDPLPFRRLFAGRYA